MLRSKRLSYIKEAIALSVLSVAIAFGTSAYADGRNYGTANGAPNQSLITDLKFFLAFKADNQNNDPSSQTVVSDSDDKGVDISAEEALKQAEQKAAEKKEAEAEAQAEAEAEALAKQRAELVAWSHFDLAHFYESRFELELADAEFEETILNAPNLKVAHRDYCLLCIARLNLPKAIAEFMLATGLGEPVPYTDMEKAELDARAAKLHYRKAIAFGRTGKWPSAIIELKWAQTYAPLNATIKRSLAFAYASGGEFDKAEEAYSDSFKQDPSDAFSHADFAYLLSEVGKSKIAVGQMSKAVELQPRVAALHVDLAWFSEKNGDLERASKELQEAVKLSPKHAVLWAHLGRVSDQLGDHAAARKAYDEALALDPQSPEAKEGLSKFRKLPD